MTRWYVWSLVLVMGCEPGGSTVPGTTTTGSSTGTATGTGTGTGTGGTGSTLDASCTVDPVNGLRVWCEVELDAAGTPSVTLSAPGAPTRTFSAEQADASPTIFAWGLKPDTDYQWTIGDFNGTVSTDSLPAGLAGMNLSMSGTLAGMDAILVPINCGNRGYAMIDGDGDVVWYQQNSTYTNQMDGYEWNQADRSLLIGSRQNVYEVDVAGFERLHLSGISRAHHDLERWGAYTYVLHDYEVNNLQVDGIHVYEGTTLIDTFHFEDHFTISPPAGGFPGDWSHSNSVTATPEGVIVVSLLNFDSVVAIDGDPNSSTFLDILWIAAGTTSGLPGADYQAPSGTGMGFNGQHNATFTNDRLYLFDNTGINGASRAARYQLTGGEVRFEEGWSVGEACPIQGGAVPVEGGRVLASCATSRDVYLFEEGNPDPVFSMNATCSNLFNEPMNRAIPVTIE